MFVPLLKKCMDNRIIERISIPFFIYFQYFCPIIRNNITNQTIINNEENDYSYLHRPVVMR